MMRTLCVQTGRSEDRSRHLAHMVSMCTCTNPLPPCLAAHVQPQGPAPARTPLAFPVSQQLETLEVPRCTRLVVVPSLNLVVFLTFVFFTSFAVIMGRSC